MNTQTRVPLDALLREQIVPRCERVVRGFDVFAWMKNNPDVAREIEQADTEIDALRVARKHLEPYLNKIAQDVEWREKQLVDAAVKYQKAIDTTRLALTPTENLVEETQARIKFEHAVYYLLEARNPKPNGAEVIDG